MKRIFLACLAAVLALALVGCDGAAVPEQMGDSSVVESQEPVLPTESVDVKSRTITFTEEDAQSLRDYLGVHTYMIFYQMMDNGIEGQSVYSSTRYTLAVNVTQKVHSLSMKYITVSGIDREGVGYSLYSDGTSTLISEDGAWVEAPEGYESLAWDLSRFHNTLDVYNYLLHDLELPVGKDGTAVGGYWTFEWSEPAVDSLLVGLKYDELLNADYKFTFREVDDHIAPDSVTVRVGYIVDEVQYYVESTIQINSVGDTKIAMPKVGDKS